MRVIWIYERNRSREGVNQLREYESNGVRGGEKLQLQILPTSHFPV